MLGQGRWQAGGRKSSEGILAVTHSLSTYSMHMGYLYFLFTRARALLSREGRATGRCILGSSTFV
jgi:hypothetical protein